MSVIGIYMFTNTSLKCSSSFVRELLSFGTDFKFQTFQASYVSEVQSKFFAYFRSSAIDRDRANTW